METNTQSAEGFRVLIGIDKSANSEYAFDYYMQNLHRDGNNLVLVHVAEFPHAMFTSESVWEEVIHREKERTHHIEKEYQEKMDKMGVSGRFVSTFGNNPGEAIVHTAESEKANMVVLGTRGQGKVRRTILGSVSDYVIHHAHCAVVVCRQEHEHHHHHHHGFHLPGHHHHHGKDKDHHEQSESKHHKEKH